MQRRDVIRQGQKRLPANYQGAWGIPGALLAASMLLSGCGLASAPTGSLQPQSTAGVSLNGRVHGGQQPVSGSSVYLFAASNSGYAAAATSLLKTATAGVSTDVIGNGYVITDAAGNFSITGDYTCPSSDAQVYLLASGGNPGLPSPTAKNDDIALMAALGNCGNLNASTFVIVNEVTTVAAVYALAPFMRDAQHIGTPSTNLAGLVEAFNGAAQLSNTANGSSPGPALPAGATLSVAQIDTLANILASCINSAGGLAGDGSICASLFANAPADSDQRNDTISSMRSIATHPSSNISGLFSLVTSNGPFQPTLVSAPNDWTISAQYKPSGLTTPRGIAIDANNTVWIADCGSAACASTGVGKVMQLGSDGALVNSTAAGLLNVPVALAIDQGGSAWVANYAGNSVTKLNVNLTAAGAAYAGGGLNSPNSIAIDPAGQAWVTNAGNGSVTVLSSSGTALTPSSGYSGVSIPTPVGILINSH